MVALNLFKFGLKILSFLFRLTGIPSLISTLTSLDIGHSSEWVNIYGVKFKEIISYVYYFIPKSYLQPFFTIFITFAILRVVFALFRVITDLL